jgi:putative hemolysin
MAFERSKLILEKVGLERVHRLEPHIVDQLIEERGAQLVNHPLWPVMRPFLNRVFHYRQAIRMADELAPLSGLEGLDYISKLLDLSLTVRGERYIPAKGGFILVANHPTGIADGIAVYDAVRAVRRDLAILSNRDALRINRRFGDVLIPVEWRDELKSKAKTRETLIATSRAVAEERALVIFPSGRIGYWANGRLNERPWQNSALALARRYRLPLLPVHVGARNSWLFYWLANWSTELRDMTVFHELLNKKRKPFRIHFGAMIESSRLDGDLASVTRQLQHHCAEALAHDPEALFRRTELDIA